MSKKRNKRSPLRGLLLLGLLAFFGAAAYGLYYLQAPRAIPAAGVMVAVPAGAPAQRVAQELERQGVISNWQLFYAYIRLTGKARGIQSGDYLFAGVVSPSQVLDKMLSGEVLIRNFTIPPGWRVRDVLLALQDFGQLLDLSGLPPPDRAQNLLVETGLGTGPAEGWLFPDSYRIDRGSKAVDLLARAHDRMKQVMAEEWAGRAPGLPIKTPEEALTLASIVEKETGVETEKPLVAAVFVNRLRTGMRLQTDPTVIYGLGEAYDGNIRLQDLRTPTAYNTYTMTGLPPTPIALPNRSSIHAALHPADSKALYFVADGKGGHVFTDNYPDHERAVKRLLASQKQKS
ncbi:endolytic transglycosylase MltG [Thermithiobacillus plumbiphilus]|uniref:Endolytic murein transglycosylase n=1 Tax=Thermithiobacillus plumbiphilus TaxID=1729899 RepID=A0ABU9D4D1_9PROT